MKPMTSGFTRRALFGAGGIAFTTRSIRGAQQTSRVEQSYRMRLAMARYERDLPVPQHTTNGDESNLPGRIGNYSKALPHNQLGEVDPAAFDSLVAALASGKHEDLEQVPMGCPDPTQLLKFTNPGAGLTFDLEGADSHHLYLPPAPAFASAEAASEMAELYWMAATRDVPFANYDSDPSTQAAAAELSKLSDFRGPKSSGQVTTRTLYRGSTAGDLAGPYVSQFLWQPLPYGSQVVDQRIRTAAPAIDFATNFSEWLSLQNGFKPSRQLTFDGPRYIRSSRDLTRWVQQDVLYGAYLNAAWILLTGKTSDPQGVSGMAAPLNSGNPYLNSVNQIGFGTFGAPHIQALLGEYAVHALHAVWFQKWFVHRRLRPEEFGGRVQQTLARNARYPIHPDLLNASVMQQTFKQQGSYLLPQAYPEGCPTHPSYGAGHATVGGACITLLKAFFDESYVIPNPVMASSDGLALVPYTGPDAGQLTVGGELNKLGSNIATGRNFAGIHYRTDFVNSLALGEEVAIRLLTDQRRTYGDAFSGFTFTKFDGETITV